MTFAQVMSDLDGLFTDPGFDASFNQLIEASEVTTLIASSDDIKKMAERPLVGETSRRAMVAGRSEILVMLARLVETYHAMYGSAQGRVFLDRHSAVKWLGLE